MKRDSQGIELKLCKYCGGRGELQRYRVNEQGQLVSCVTCSQCGAMTAERPISLMRMDKKRVSDIWLDAIRDWNSGEYEKEVIKA